jgi:two-component system sensor histidine kinase RegB
MSMQDGGANETVMLIAWLQRCTEQWRLRQPAVRLDLSLPPGDVRIGHTQAIGQILLTLLDNAAQAAARGDTPIHLSLQLASHSAVIRITDKGRGIEPDLLKRLGYEPVQSTSGGQGIGLMLAFATARQIGATIALASCPRDGAVATLMVPLA